MMQRLNFKIFFTEAHISFTEDAHHSTFKSLYCTSKYILHVYTACSTPTKYTFDHMLQMRSLNCLRQRYSELFCRELTTRLLIPDELMPDVIPGGDVNCFMLFEETVPSGAYVDPYQLKSLRPFDGPDVRKLLICKLNTILIICREIRTIMQQLSL